MDDECDICGSPIDDEYDGDEADGMLLCNYCLEDEGYI